ncbi:hypothetical protein SAMN05444161_5246 [Rhizobiales bacterium GAS191]|jgi:predicted pyridoxine 5'-phosphate oxidase superfamily flavin-nucleotide-binding protein|nr:hypothetical protein SAMN05519103_04509 [Rhizobiales bacterium GAS113]SEE25323.1 hypothetical protein SAMN05444161_5246 [Rhizobiales bacterium GAS191]
MERIVRGAGDSGAQERRVTQTPREPQISQAPWHEGERAAHARLGLSERMAEVGERALRNFMPDQHRLFFAQLPFLVVGSVDADQQPWASMLFGQPGFAMSPDPFTLDVAALPDADDPLAPAIVEGAALGLLGIELPTLRRNRMNGHVASTGPGGFSLSVDQSFGNCPQYIHRRDYEGFRRDAFARSARAERLTTLGAEELSLIARADTCFVASAAIPRGGRADGIDVSHRGGMPGFLKLDREGHVLMPDYRGNFFFNTLGNLLVNPRIGVTIVDFDKGDLLQLTGIAEVIWEGVALADHPGAKRLCKITPLAAQWLRGGFPLATTLRQISSQAMATLSMPN